MTLRQIIYGIPLALSLTIVFLLSQATRASADTLPINISGETIASVTANSATITWFTDEPATSRVVYGTSSIPDSNVSTSTAPNYGYDNSTATAPKAVRNHSVTVTGLAPGTTYYFRAASQRLLIDGTPDDVSSELQATTLANDQTGTLVITDTIYGNATASNFIADGLAPFKVTTTNGFGETTITGVQPGSYVINELIGTGFVLLDSNCDEPGEAGGIVIAGATTTCNFINYQLGSMTILQVSENDEGVFNYTTSFSGPFTLSRTPGALWLWAFNDLTPTVAGPYTLHDVYAVTQQTPYGWQITGAACSDGTHIYDPGNITLNPSAEVNCTFTNSKVSQPNKLGNINGLVFEDVNGNGVQEVGEDKLNGFKVYLDLNHNGILDAGDISAESDSDGAYSFKNVPPGTYALREDTKNHWQLTLPASQSYSVTLTDTSSTVNGRNFGNVRN